VAQEYCRPIIERGGDKIFNIAIGDTVIRDTRITDSAYTYYPSNEVLFVLQKEFEYPITITSDGKGVTYVTSIWIDLDEDKEFSKYELIYFDTIRQQSSIGTIQIPSDVETGTKRMRILRVYTMTSDTLEPCGSFLSGECEDYNIRITNDQQEINTFCYPFFSWTNSFVIDTFRLHEIVNEGSGNNRGSFKSYLSSEFTTTLETDSFYNVFFAKGSQAGILGSYSIFLDVNNNGRFEINEKLIQTPVNLRLFSGEIYIPKTSEINKELKMRVISNFADTISNACGIFRDGEAEDYLITVKSKGTTNVSNHNIEILTIYPNPVNNFLNIKLLSNQSADLHIEIRDEFGRLIRFDKSKSDQIIINTTEWISGVYFLTIQNQNFIATKRILKIN
jgi:hypothetical protein